MKCFFFISVLEAIRYVDIKTEAEAKRYLFSPQAVCSDSIPFVRQPASIAAGWVDIRTLPIPLVAANSAALYALS
jgi:hypothetical protein